MKPTKQQNLHSSLGDQIKERKEYLVTIERDIEAVTEAGNNQLLAIQGEMSELMEEKARLMKFNYSLEQKIRENKRLVEL